MQPSSAIFKKCLLLIVFAIMLMPLLQNKFNAIPLSPLKGSINKPEDPAISFTDWFSNNFQEKQEQYLNSNFGFRSLCVRINNQLAFYFFNKAKANGVIIGKNNYLFEKNYIDAYTGKDYLGHEKINKLVNRIKFVSDTLNKLNKKLLIVCAPGKASFYPEYIPTQYGVASKNTNYIMLMDKFKESNINYIDFNKWFIEQKNKSKYPLYGQYGIHWSVYGSVLAGDSIIKKIEFLKQINMPNLVYNNIELKQPNEMDYDIADGMNLFFRLTTFDMAYPNIKTEIDSSKIKPSVLVISDSFYWGLYAYGFSNSFTNDHFWYYNKQVYPESATKELLTENLDHKKEIEKHDVIIVMATEANLSKIGWGFFEEMEHLFNGDNYLQDRKKKNDLKQAILNDKKWMEDITQKASKRGISVDSMVNIDVLWLSQQKNN